LAQIALGFHNKGPSIRAIMTVISLLLQNYGNPMESSLDDEEMENFLDEEM
jgi:hypothetical protein